MKKRELRWCYFEWWYSRWNRTGKPIKSIYIYIVLSSFSLLRLYIGGWKICISNFARAHANLQLVRVVSLFPPTAMKARQVDCLTLHSLRLGFSHPQKRFYTQTAAPRASLHTPRTFVYTCNRLDFKIQIDLDFEIWNQGPRPDLRRRFGDVVYVCVCVCVYIYIERERERERERKLKYLCYLWQPSIFAASDIANLYDV